MASLPNSKQAILDTRKLEDYCLDPAHPRGRHKARVFRESLGIGPTDARWLAEILLAAAGETEATQLASDAFGSRWHIDVHVARHGRAVVVRTVWIVRTEEQVPRFVTCWVR